MSYYFKAVLSLRKKENAVDVPTTEKNNDFLIDPIQVSPTNLLVYRNVKSFLLMFDKTVLECHVGAMVEAKIVVFLRTVTQEFPANKRSQLIKD